MLPQLSFCCVFPCNCLCKKNISHVGRWGKWSSRCCPPCTLLQDLPPGRSLYHTETPQHAPCSGGVLALYRAAFVLDSHNPWLLTQKKFYGLLYWQATQFFLYLFKVLIFLPISQDFSFWLSFIPSHVGAGRLHVPLARQMSVFGPISWSPTLHT